MASGIIPRSDSGTDAYLDHPSSCDFLPDGMPDPQFSDDGVVDLHYFQFDGVCRIAKGSNSKILVLTFGGLRRLNSDGSIDATFGTAGLTIFPSDSRPEILDVMEDGRFVVGGHTYLATNPPGKNRFVRLFRFWQDGKPDPRFGQNGRADIYAANDYLPGTLQIIHSKVFLAGYYGSFGSLDPFVTRVFGTRKL